MKRFLDRIRPGRKIHGISAVFLPFRPDGTPDLEGFERHLARTVRSGLEPAVNMDTGFGPELSPRRREEVLSIARRVQGPSAPFVAGAMPFGEEGDPLAAYAASVRAILDRGGTPILFPSDALARASGAEVVEIHRRLLAPCPAALAFELSPAFAPFGRIHDLETVRRLLEIPNLVGLKHSSLSRSEEIARLEIRDRERPDFRIYTGNDLAIDMVLHGSDYLLGLSTFEPEAFAERDRRFAAREEGFFPLDDALQALGAVAFRDPIPAYKSSAAAYLRLTGALPDALPHPRCPSRPESETELLRPFAERIARERTSPPTAAEGWS